jgi:hypothetical protein
MRPSIILMLVLAVFTGMYALLGASVSHKNSEQAADLRVLQDAVGRFGLSDLALSTEARYTRHPAVSDSVVVAMDHPGAIDHFPSTLFWAQPE